jgi:hypothetical protein
MPFWIAVKEKVTGSDPTLARQPTVLIPSRISGPLWNRYGRARMDRKVGVIETVCQAILKDKLDRARRAINAGYRWDATGPFDCLHVPSLPKPFRYPNEETFERRDFKESDQLRIWRRDGFRDRYSGERLVFPGTLILLAALLPDVFPFGKRKNGDRRITHQAMSELWPAVDHIIPLTRPRELRAARVADPNADANLATTSIANNGAKDRYLYTELGWILHPSPASDDWDGLTGWFREYLSRDSTPLNNSAHGSSIRAWVKELDKLI